MYLIMKMYDSFVWGTKKQIMVKVLGYIQNIVNYSYYTFC